MQFTAHAGGHEGFVFEILGEDVRIELRDHKLGDAGAIMLLGHRDLVGLPQPSDFALSRLQDIEIDIFDGCFVRDDFQDMLRGFMTSPARIMLRKYVLPCERDCPW